MLSYTTLEDAYNLSLTGQRQHRKKRREESAPSALPQAMSDNAVLPSPVSNTAHVPVAPQVPPFQQTPISALGNNQMFIYIAVLVILVFAGMIYDIRTSLHEIHQTLKIIASSKSLS